MQQLSLTEIQIATKEIVKFIDDLCNKLGLKYFALYGTVIGAIRHQGFIPWDDDFDIGMFRKDFEIFKEYMLTHDTGFFYLDNVEANKEYPFYISRVCDKRYQLVFEGFNYTSGLFVDIYPYDGLGNSEDIIWWKKRSKRLYNLRKGMLLSRWSTLFFGNSTFHRLFNIPYLLFCRMAGNSFFFKRLDRYSKFFDVDKSQYVDCPCWAGRIHFYEKKWFEETIRVKFENITICIPKEYDSFLRSLYGDYMVLPPESKRIPTHGYKAYKI